MNIDLDSLNARLRNAPAAEIVEWALEQGRRGIVTTSMGPNAAVMLHLVTRVAPRIPVIWVDTGYNLRDTYIVAESLIRQLDLNIFVYTPRMTAERRTALQGGIPTVDDVARHRIFTEQVKLEPFNRALRDFEPEIWLTGIRREETAHRRALDILSADPRGVLKVAPLFYWSEVEVESYLASHQLPTCQHYFDPTKVYEGRECGLHTAA
jgi:phosphoadenosine phosphosulfate reductase